VKINDKAICNWKTTQYHWHTSE